MIEIGLRSMPQNRRITMSEPAKPSASSAATTEQLAVLEREYANHGDSHNFFQVVCRGTHNVPFEIADDFVTTKKNSGPHSST